MYQPRVLVIQDISASCRISMNVAQPILSVLNNEVNVLPTALLSTHTTSGFEDYTYLDLTEESDKILEHWQELGRTFDGVLVGYMGSVEQIRRSRTIVETFLNEDGLFVLDPVMADLGELYDGFTEEYVDEMCRLSARADIIIPNITEAAFLTRTEFESIDDIDISKLIHDMASINQKHVIITGVKTEDQMGAASFNYSNEGFDVKYAPFIEGHFEGTGDLFSSVVAGLMLQGKSVHRAMEIAVVYINKVIRRTNASNKEIRYGVQFETDIPYLIGQLYNEQSDKEIINMLNA